MKLLRSPDGCPWDREQSHESIAKNFIEETYEAIEAINKKDPGLLCEELGDVLLQVVFHACMEDEKGVFDINDVADGICKKLIERHPHVFGDLDVSGSDEVLSNWDDIKRRSKKQDTFTEAMEAVPKELPSLMRSEKLQAKAAKAGLDFADSDGAFLKLKEETEELYSAYKNSETEHIEEELGDLLFSAANISRFLHISAELSLNKANDKFRKRFSFVEKEALASGKNMKDMANEELDVLWEKSKFTD
ncbi:MAG: nucleoside triphosphate pyrophosphohydrolase [Oscillospiraceae bacterium]|nr:nucleoside triphosphate pyrophosphohydrolase [Oscillospiraceae bacterium]